MKIRKSGKIRKFRERMVDRTVKMIANSKISNRTVRTKIRIRIRIRIAKIINRTERKIQRFECMVQRMKTTKMTRVCNTKSSRIHNKKTRGRSNRKFNVNLNKTSSNLYKTPSQFR